MAARSMGVRRMKWRPSMAILIVGRSFFWKSAPVRGTLMVRNAAMPTDMSPAEVA